jgi:hypothetical protein
MMIVQIENKLVCQNCQQLGEFLLELIALFFERILEFILRNDENN